jgi:hypothetical protein
VVLIAAVGAGVYYVAAYGVLDAEPFPEATQDDDALSVDWCTPLRVVTATSFRPVLDDVEPLVSSGDVCVQLDVQVANGVDAFDHIAAAGAHVWIPDDVSWAGDADQLMLSTDAPGAGTVVATSPFYMVTDETTGQQITDAGGWLGLTTLLSDGVDGPALVLQDPERSGDGMVAAAAIGESVWADAGMDASSQAMIAALPSIRIVEDDALPEEGGEVGLVPEYAVLRSADEESVADAVLLPGDDHTAMLRYAWVPTGIGSDDPAVEAALARLLNVLSSSEADEARAAAGLRGPDMSPVPSGAQEWPAPEAAPFEAFSAHAVDHVFATFYAENRRADVQLVIDISSSMASPAAGSDVPILDLVKAGARDMVDLLPDNAQVGLWQFGTQLDPPSDWVELVGIAPLGSEHRQDLNGALSDMFAIDTGTGLYNTMLDAYLDAQEQYQAGVPSHVVVFTDGLNAFRPGSLTVDELTEALAEAHDPARPVELSVVAMGSEPDAELLVQALEPVESYLAQINTAEEIRATFIHLAAGGVHH